MTERENPQGEIDSNEQYPDQPPATWEEPSAQDRYRQYYPSGKVREKYSEYYGKPGSTFDYLREKFGLDEAERAMREKGGRR